MLFFYISRFVRLSEGLRVWVSLTAAVIPVFWDVYWWAAAKVQLWVTAEHLSSFFNAHRTFGPGQDRGGAAEASCSGTHGNVKRKYGRRSRNGADQRGYDLLSVWWSRFTADVFYVKIKRTEEVTSETRRAKEPETFIITSSDVAEDNPSSAWGFGVIKIFMKTKHRRIRTLITGFTLIR